MAASIAQERARERIARLCRTSVPARQLRAAVLDQLRQVIGFDSYVFVLTDPHTCVGVDPLADVPLLDELPRLIRLKYATTVNRWTGLGDPPVARLYEGTGGRREQSLLWREMLGPAGIVDVASVVFRDRFGCWGFLDLWRAGPANPFSRADADFLATIAPAVTEALRSCQAATFSAHPAEASRRAPLVLLLSPDLTIQAQTRQTHDYLRQLLPTPAERSAIPAAAYNVAAQLVAVEAGIDEHPATGGVHLADGIWITLRAARIGDNGPEHPGDIVVTIEQASPAERLGIFRRAFGLSTREAELLTVLADGADTRQAAQRMLLSRHTVQDHLKSIFTKTAVHSRRELLTRALG
ncbi:helix-turn-helix transcriptional regulator [Micromonospora sp. SL4-19]|uniref:helix-turn-helix transcriptional regulator n=1 Tax=Micromonospora sp. SL4-19 TaxID=3399129 RepID=UPI003A4E55EC